MNYNYLLIGEAVAQPQITVVVFNFNSSFNQKQYRISRKHE